MPSHSEIMKMVQMDWSKINRGRMFPNDNGQAYTGKCTNEYFITSKGYRKKVVELYGAYRIRYGLDIGSPDLIGFEYAELSVKDGETRIIKKIPIFSGVEVKTLKYKKLSKDQKDWLNFMYSIGGRPYVAREEGKGYQLFKWEDGNEFKTD